MIAAADPLDRLTERERQIFALLGEGWTASDIATELLLVRKTVLHHLSSIRGKLKLATPRHLSDAAVTRHVVDSLAAGPNAPERILRREQFSATA